jgi:hypothetical protein
MGESSALDIVEMLENDVTLASDPFQHLPTRISHRLLVKPI